MVGAISDAVVSPKSAEACMLQVVRLVLMVQDRCTSSEFFFKRGL